MTSRTGRRRTGQLSASPRPCPGPQSCHCRDGVVSARFRRLQRLHPATGGATATATAQAGAVGGSAGAEPLPTPLATSVHASGGTWATVPMGDLGQPLNTFWQLLFRPDGSASWSDRVEATAVATNGGLVLAGGGQALVVGVRPSNLLTFSPLIATTNAGRSWSNGLLSQGLAPRPAALATGPAQTLAIVEGRGGTKVVRATGTCCHGIRLRRPAPSPLVRPDTPVTRRPSRLSVTFRPPPWWGRAAGVPVRPGSSCKTEAPGYLAGRPFPRDPGGPKSSASFPKGEGWRR